MSVSAAPRPVPLSPDRWAAAAGVAVAAVTAICLLEPTAGRTVVDATGLLAGLLAAGVGGFLVLLPPTSSGTTAPVTRLVLPLVVVGFAAALLVLPFAAMNAAGTGLQGLTERLAWDAAVRGGLAQSVVVRALGLVGLVLATRLTGGRGRAATGLAALAIAGSFLLTGHARTGTPAAAVVVVALVHVTAAAAWTGGLLALATVLRTAPDGAALGRVVTTFARVMTGVVVMIVGGGVGLALLYLPRPGALVTDLYGQLILMKVALVLGVLMVSAANHRRLVPAVAAGGRRARRILAMNVTVEQILLVAVVVVTDVLMRQNPAA